MPRPAFRELLQEEQGAIWTPAARGFVLGIVLAALWTRGVALETGWWYGLGPALMRFLPRGLALALVGQRSWAVQPLPQMASLPWWHGRFVHFCLALSLVSLVAALVLPGLSVRAGRRPATDHGDRRFLARWLALVLPFAGLLLLAAVLVGGLAVAR